MSLAGDVINRARDVHPAFTRQQTPDATALRILNGARLRLFSVATRAHRAAFLTTVVVPITPVAFTTGLVLSPSRYVENARQQELTDLVRLPLLENAGESISLYSARYGVLSGQRFTELRLYPADAQAWLGTTAIQLDVIADLVPLQLLSSDVVLTNDADEALAFAVALQMATRGATEPQLPPLDLGGLERRMVDAEVLYLGSLSEQRRGKSFQVREAMT